jgi:hypothetical protein
VGSFDPPQRSFHFYRSKISGSLRPGAGINSPRRVHGFLALYASESDGDYHLATSTGGVTNKAGWERRRYAGDRRRHLCQ